MQASDIFADIRPFNDQEVSQVLQRLLASSELPQAIVGFNLPWLPIKLRALFVPVLRFVLKRKLRHVHTVEDFQHSLSRMLKTLVKRTCQEVEVRGLDKLTPGQAYLWISNHRDIAMDPLLINYSLYRAGWPTSRIAIGDNLLANKDVADIMRLNKSFVVKRNVDSLREKLAEFKKLSAYIRHSLDTGHSVWLAHKEGRAKDGIDKTDTAVLKMLALQGRALSEDFTTSMMALNPVPVCIQYEWDPCDVLKAKELVAIKNKGSYQKAEGEDTHSILLGLLGKKGKVVISFGQPLTPQECETAEVMAKVIDAQLASAQAITNVQTTALSLLQQLDSEYEQYQGAELTVKVAKQLNDRFSEQSKDVYERALKTYAMPLLLANKKG